ncbi:MAG: hypothetical protein QOJ09_1401, partial [Actinomycetota bacterium]|nr:hypothetical protein [Actinomycetota bacterium]
MIRRRWHVLLGAMTPIVVVATLAMSLQAPAIEAARIRTRATATSTGSVAVLELTVATTSDWSRLILSNGRFAGSTVTASTTGVTATVTSNAVVLNTVPAGGGSATVRVLFDEPTGANPVTAIIHKGAGGTTHVTVTRTSPGPRTTVLDVVNPISKDALNEMRTPMARAMLLGPNDAPLPHADGRKLTLAFYYPWAFAQPGGTPYSDPSLADRPTTPSDTSNAADVLAMTRQARANGINGFIVSFNGPTATTNLSHVARAAESTGSVYSAYLETHLATSSSSGGKPDKAVVRSWLAGLVMNAKSSSAFLRAGGIPVVFVYQMDKLPAADWQAILTEFAGAGLPVRLVGDAPLPTYGSVMWGNHQYNPNFKTPTELDAFNRDRRLSSRAAAVL